MKRAYAVFGILWAQVAVGQVRLPILHAHSRQVSIRDGAFYSRNAWTLSPETKPDVYTADRTRNAKWVTFYTDSDSIRTEVRPGSSFDFIILLNGKDSCYTRIISAVEALPQKRIVAHSDTIPFVLTAYNSIAIKAVLDGRDTLALHFDIGSFDFRITKEALQRKTHLLDRQADFLAGKAAANFNRLAPLGALRLGTYEFRNPEILATTTTAHGMDGRFGYNLFEGKCVEINYTNNQLVIHTTLPAGLTGYTRFPLTFMQSFVCMEAELKVQGKRCRGNFLLDTGSDQAMLLDSIWLARQALPEPLQVVRVSTVSDPRGVVYQTKTACVPEINLGPDRLANVPALLLGSRNPVGFEVNYLGNDLLKRFDTVLDLQHDVLYLKPNRLFGKGYRGDS